EPARATELLALAVALRPLRLLLLPLRPLLRVHERAGIRTLLHGCRRAIATRSNRATAIEAIKRPLLPEEVEDAADDQQPPRKSTAHVMHISPLATYDDSVHESVAIGA